MFVPRGVVVLATLLAAAAADTRYVSHQSPDPNPIIFEDTFVKQPKELHQTNGATLPTYQSDVSRKPTINYPAVQKNPVNSYEVQRNPTNYPPVQKNPTYNNEDIQTRPDNTYQGTQKNPTNTYDEVQRNPTIHKNPINNYDTQRQPNHDYQGAHANSYDEIQTTPSAYHIPKNPVNNYPDMNRQPSDNYPGVQKNPVNNFDEVQRNPTQTQKTPINSYHEVQRQPENSYPEVNKQSDNNNNYGQTQGQPEKNYPNAHKETEQNQPDNYLTNQKYPDDYSGLQKDPNNNFDTHFIQNNNRTIQKDPVYFPYNNNTPSQYPTHTKTEDHEETATVKYYGSQVWNVVIDEHSKLVIVGHLSRSKEVSSWGGNHTAVDFLVKPENRDRVAKILRDSNIKYSVVIEDLQRNIDAENPPLNEEEQELQDRKGHRMTWHKYHRLSDIHGFLDYLADTYPSICSVMTIGRSHQGRDLKMLRISNGQPNNKAVLVDGGIHAREWISPATVTYIINQFVENYDTESSTVRNLDWYFLPVLNPDGYEFTHTIDRLWRKNRKGYGVCSGTDLNRNFGYKWGGMGTSKNPCSEVYPGQQAFSEPESRALRDFVSSSSADFKLYATYHSYGEYILYPWGYDKVVTTDCADLDRVGNEAAEAILQAGGNKYRVGTSSLILYPASGGSDDWAKANGIKYAYTIELSDRGQYGFILPAHYIVKVAKESIAGLRALAHAAYLA